MNIILLTFKCFFSIILVGTFNPTPSKSWENLLYVKEKGKYHEKFLYAKKRNS